MDEMANEEREDKFEIRTLTKTSTGLKKYFLDVLEKEKFLPALDDIECYLACDPTSLLVGELNGKPIAIAAAFKYEEQYSHFGCYVVDKAYRGQGYGLKITAEARRRSEPDGVETGYTVPEMLENYKKMCMAVQHWPVEMHMVDVPNALTLLNDGTSTNGGASLVVDIKQVGEIDVKAVCNYDTKIFGYKREKFLERLLQVSHARVAVNQQNEIVGYAAARVLYKQDSGYKVGPVFGESFEIAKSLLKEIFQEIMECGRSSKKTVVINFPVVVNSDANKLAKLLCGKILMKCMFVSCNGLPKSDFTKWFAVTTLDAG
jgi:predicted GNAT family acetyltransferase